jgi:predicted RNase H-like HicB family nuclease
MNLEDYMGLEYLTVILEDRYTNGTRCFLAMHPQLPGCMSHGDSTEEAVHNLEDARREYIASLIEDGLEVPTPVVITTGTGYYATGSEFALEQPTIPAVKVESDIKDWTRSVA